MIYHVVVLFLSPLQRRDEVVGAERGGALAVHEREDLFDFYVFDVHWFDLCLGGEGVRTINHFI